MSAFIQIYKAEHKYSWAWENVNTLWNVYCNKHALFSLKTLTFKYLALLIIATSQLQQIYLNLKGNHDKTWNG